MFFNKCFTNDQKCFRIVFDKWGAVMDILRSCGWVLDSSCYPIYSLQPHLCCIYPSIFWSCWIFFGVTGSLESTQLLSGEGGGEQSSVYGTQTRSYAHLRATWSGQLTYEASFLDLSEKTGEKPTHAWGEHTDGIQTRALLLWAKSATHCITVQPCFLSSFLLFPSLILKLLSSLAI